MKLQSLCQFLVRFMIEMMRTRRAALRRKDQLYNELAREFQRAISDGRVMAATIVEKNGIIQALQQEILLDPLTGLYRRNAEARLIHPLLHTWQRHQLSGGNCPPMVALMMDVDHFKRVNDTLGHAAGDAVLKRIAHLARLVFRRDNDFVIRFGGEELFIVSMNMTPMDASRRAEELRKRIENDPELALASGQVTASFGISSVLIQSNEDVSVSLEAARARADRALYQVKASGRNGIAIN